MWSWRIVLTFLPLVHSHPSYVYANLFSFFPSTAWPFMMQFTFILRKPIWRGIVNFYNTKVQKNLKRSLITKRKSKLLNFLRVIWCKVEITYLNRLYKCAFNNHTRRDKQNDFHAGARTSMSSISGIRSHKAFIFVPSFMSQDILDKI